MYNNKHWWDPRQILQPCWPHMHIHVLPGLDGAQEVNHWAKRPAWAVHWLESQWAPMLMPRNARDGSQLKSTLSIVNHWNTNYIYKRIKLYCVILNMILYYCIYIYTILWYIYIILCYIYIIMLYYIVLYCVILYVIKLLISYYCIILPYIV